ncbi:hypothetical protein [Kitasatospora sp. NBC_01266]|uniref:hypothetical protein n=1 Tax=Kitasatospora sp. NBC_01266 TaxID=2903572 RepID=UPI002E307768|nr:hypothetical protein [Kitasatospora sp. NBC_01266]
MTHQLGPWTVSPEARHLYLAVLHTQSVDSAADPQALAELLRFGLVIAHPEGPDGRYLALNPSEAAAQRREILLGQISEAMAGTAALPATIQDLAIAWQYRPHQSHATGAVEHLEGVEAINARISEILAQTSSEMLTAQPGGPRPASSLALSLPRDLDALHRGVAVRTLYMDSVRMDEATAAHVRTMTAAGAHVRTSGTAFLRALVFDRRAAVLRDYMPWTGPGSEPQRALIVEDEALVHYVAAMFDREWARAAVWKGERAVPPTSAGDPLTPRQQDIARHLAAGAGQAAVAAALQVSERVVQGDLAAMRRMLGCNTNAALLFELGRRAGRGEWS